MTPARPTGSGGPPERPAARRSLRYADEGHLTMIPELRRARPDDVPAIAALFRLSSGGVADYVWRSLAAPGEDPLEVGIRRYARRGADFSYENCLVADDDGAVVGMINAFALRASGEPAGEEDPVLRPYAELEAPDSLYVSGIALLPPYRGQGLGTRMMVAMRERARAEGLKQLSLIAFAENAASVRLYERLGYRIVDRRAVVPHPLIQYRGDAVLMVAPA